MATTQETWGDFHRAYVHFGNTLAEALRLRQFVAWLARIGTRS